MTTATLPGHWYGDPAVHELERRNIFGREWLFVGLVDQLREVGDYIATSVAGWNVLVVMGDDGRLRGHHNVCRHRAGPLVADGTGHVPSLVCRYHGWAYALDGQLKSARDFGGDLDCDGVALTPIRVDQWRGLVFLNIDHDAPPLLDALGTFADACTEFPIEQFAPAAGREYALECNWKTYADNYLEGYHIPLVHPGLNKEIDTKRYEVDVDEHGRWVEQHAPARDGSVISGRWLWRWPNLALNLVPGGMTIERYEPIDSRHTRLRYTYAVADPDDAEIGEILRISDEVTVEDITICEAVQRNLDTGVYAQGWLSPRHEGAVAAFQSWVWNAVS